jgi:hypothetical protein
MVRGLGTDQSLVDQMVDRSIELGTAPLSETDRAERVLVLPSERNMAVLIAELDRRVPIQQAKYDQFLDQGALSWRILATEFGGPDLKNLAVSFTADALRERNQFERSGQDEQDDDTQNDQPATASVSE